MVGVIDDFINKDALKQFDADSIPAEVQLLWDKARERLRNHWRTRINPNRKRQVRQSQQRRRGKSISKASNMFCF